MSNTYTAIVTSTILYLLLMGILHPTYAQEHPTGREHPGRTGTPETELPNRKPVPTREVTPDEIRENIRTHIDQTLKSNNNLFPIKDDKTKQSLKLEFIKVHDDKVSIIKAKSEYDTDTYFACTD